MCAIFASDFKQKKKMTKSLNILGLALLGLLLLVQP